MTCEIALAYLIKLYEIFRREILKETNLWLPWTCDFSQERINYLFYFKIFKILFQSML